MYYNLCRDVLKTGENSPPFLNVNLCVLCCLVYDEYIINYRSILIYIYIHHTPQYSQANWVLYWNACVDLNPQANMRAKAANTHTLTAHKRTVLYDYTRTLWAVLCVLFYLTIVVFRARTTLFNFDHCARAAIDDAEEGKRQKR